jgi:activator of HSP90 ATPase
MGKVSQVLFSSGGEKLKRNFRRMTTSSGITTGVAAAGSVWNKNSWHWEEKDYNKVAQSHLKEVLKSTVLTHTSGQTVELTDIEPGGFASISVRKGKKVVVFEFAISMKASCDSKTGSIKIPEFSNDELDPTIRVDFEDESIKDYLRKDGAKVIKQSLSKFVEFINQVETGENVLEADKQRREEELARAKQAEIEKGLEKQRIAEAVKAKEREATSNRTFVEASVWNPNSYHWETRKLDKWAFDWIESKLTSDASFSDIAVTGEAENSIRKGKKITIFNLRIEGKYKGDSFSVPSFSNEEGDDEIPKISTFSTMKGDLEKSLKSLVFIDFLGQLKDQ